MVLIELVCEGCGGKFTRNHWDHKHGRAFCCKQCWLNVYNNSERNTKIARDTIKERSDNLRAYGDLSGKWYRKVDGVHEHITVMEKKLGRKLLPGEVVHHKDHDKRNNDPGNLEVKSRSQHAKDHADEYWGNI